MFFAESNTKMKKQSQIHAKRICRLKRREDFLFLRDGKKCKGDGFMLTAKQRSRKTDLSSDIARIGFTVTKKVGNAVTRNRIKRRFKEATRIGLQHSLLPNYDYNVIAYSSSLNVPFDRLINNLQACAKKL